MKPLKTCLIVYACLAWQPAYTQNDIHINAYFSTNPGIGLVWYKPEKHFGMGLSAYIKPYDGTRTIDVLGGSRRYAPVHTDLHLDFMFGNPLHPYRLNPFIYGYYGKSTARFTDWNSSARQYYTSTVPFEKWSLGAGLNILHGFGDDMHARSRLYFLFGFSAGYKTVRSPVNLYRGPEERSTEDLALRFHFGFVASLNN